MESFFAQMEEQRELLSMQRMLEELRSAAPTSGGPRASFLAKAVQAVVALEGSRIAIQIGREDVELTATLPARVPLSLAEIFTGSQRSLRPLESFRWMLWLALGTRPVELDFHWLGSRIGWKGSQATFADSTESCRLRAQWSHPWWQFGATRLRGELVADLVRRVALCRVPITIDGVERRAFPELVCRNTPPCNPGKMNRPLWESNYYWLSERLHSTRLSNEGFAVAQMRLHELETKPPALISEVLGEEGCTAKGGGPSPLESGTHPRSLAAGVVHVQAYSGLRALPDRPAELIYVQDGVALDPLPLPKLAPGLSGLLCRDDMVREGAFGVKEAGPRDEEWLAREGRELWRGSQRYVVQVKAAEEACVPQNVRNSWRQLLWEKRVPS